MTSESRELSVQDGSPTELWVFTIYGQNHRYTPGARDYVYLGSTYEGWPLSHTPFERTATIPKNNLTLYVTRDFPMLAFFKRLPPSDVLWLTIFLVHRGEGDVLPLWTGRVMNAERKGRKAEMYCENIFTSLRRNGLEGTYGRNCRHELYSLGDGECNANPDDFVFEAQLDSVNGLQITSAAFPAYMDGDRGRLAGGFLEYEPTPGHIERRGLKFHDGDTVEMTHAIENLAGLAEVRLWPGCAHDRTDCNDNFSNINNYGGFPFVPRLNPMGQSSVF